MTQILRQSTQVIVVVGPFVDVGDGFTPETGVTLSGADEAELLKANTTTTTDISGATWAAITGCDGYYGLTLTTSLTDTLGPMTVMVNDDSVCLPVLARFQVLPSIVYDSFFPSAAGNPLPVFGILDWGTAQASAAGTLVHRAGLDLANDIPNGATEFVYGGTGAGQARVAHDFVNATDTASVSPDWTTTPDGTSTYATFASPPGSTGSPPAANVTQWLGTAAATPTVAGVPEVDATHYLGAAAPALVGGRFDASVGAMAANTLTATAINADAITAAKVAADVGTEIGAAVLAAAAADPIDANVEQINTVAIVGDGSGTPFTV